MPTKKTGKSKTKIAQQEESKTNSFFKFGESYTSLILGIIVVIISTVLLLSFVHNKNVTRTNQNQQLANNQLTVSPTPSETVTVAPTSSVVTPIVTKAPMPTKIPTATPKVETKKVSPTVTPKQVNAVKGSTYTIAEGDSLWSISEKVYDSGYNWVDIARANNLNEPGVLHVGNKLKLPKVEPKIATVEKPAVTKGGVITEKAASIKKITGSTYKIVKGDDLWDIAERAYGDGYKWVDIARANNLNNPGLIHVDNTIKIPRNK